ncbi:TRAM domain-containing protein [Oscillatoria amoena NRMC-F 0135]|nr:TRAM domain-containing protein [Oscillatoria amoena NRMC-F 0135]
MRATQKKSADEYKGRNDQNVTVIFPKENAKPGDYVNVLIERSTTTSIIGRIVN